MADYRKFDQTEEFANAVLSNRMSRRTMVRRAAALGVSVPVLSSLIAACGGDDGEEEDTDDTGQTDDTADETEGADSETETDESATEEPEAEDTADEAAGDEGAQESIFDEHEPPQNQGGQIIEGAFSDAETINGILTQDTASSRVLDMLTLGVITTHPITTEPHPEVAESWDISDDGLEYTFNLRDDITWHDGEDVTAADVVFTYETHMQEDAGSARFSELTSRIASVEAADDYTVVFTLNMPASPFLQSNMVYHLVPEHVLADVAPADLASHPFSTGEKGTTIGCGPFQFEEWVSGDHITLVKYADYYLGEPAIDQWIRRIVPDQTVLAQQIGTGELDYGAIQESDVETLQQQEGVDVTVYDAFDFTFFAYQLDEERTTLFQDKAVRQALLYGLDRQALVDSIRFGIGEVAIGTMPVPSWAYNPEGIELKYEFDPDRARQMLEEAGWVEGDDGVRERDGERLAFTVYTNAGNEIREQYVAVMQEQWREIGVECTPQTEEWNAFLDRITSSRDFEMFLVGFSWTVDPHQQSMWHTDSQEGGFNMNRYSNPDVDALLDQALETTDQAERTELYTQMQNLIMEDLPSPILDFPQGKDAVNQRVHNVFPNDVEYTINAHQWWVDG